MLKTIPSYPRYQINEDGTQILDTETGKFVRIYKETNGYMRVQLKGGRVKAPSVHVLVAEAWIGPCPPGMTVDHIDEVKHNNRYTNLEYTTQSEQQKRSFGKKGAVRRRFTDDEIRFIRGKPFSQQVLADMFGVSHRMIQLIQKRLRYANVPDLVPLEAAA